MADRSTHAMQGVRNSNRAAVRRPMVAGALSLMLISLWAVMHRSQGIILDGKLYAVQAMARLHPGLASDVYLENTSQDRYTFFSHIYASIIGRVGLENAELLLFVMCTVWFLAAAWVLARELWSAEVAWLAVAMLVVTVGYYGAYRILHFSESYLTARSLAEALVVTSLACHFHGRRRMGLLVAVGAFFIHPIMALPGFLLLICLRFPIRQTLIGAAAGLLLTYVVALTASIAPASMHVFQLIDAPWLEVVRQRSQFLFFEYWTSNDWEMNVRPLLSLAVTASVIPEERIRRLCAAAALVGSVGMAVNYIVSSVGPVAILLQGQAWRWMWISSFAAILLLVPTAFCAWRDSKCGPICACLVISAWTFPAIQATAVLVLAWGLWSLRTRINDNSAKYLHWAAMAFVSIAVAWALATAWNGLTSPMAESGRDPAWIADIRAVCALQIPAVMFVGLFWYVVTSRQTAWASALGAVMAVFAALILPGSLKQVGTLSSDAEFDEFADWRSAIPPANSVLVVPTGNSASFVWFTLLRPSYMSVDQSAGVVFARDAALEIRRRSEILLPIADPVWQLLKQNMRTAHGHKPQQTTRPLTTQALISICNDPQLGFVAAKEDIGFEPIRHNHPGVWKDWNLYDCRRVRLGSAAS
jgi:hypothetical protein